ncbi:sensor histidine kinase [Albibacillus kandeliae]|uniref:sensor histidine kinase n=1 Tax=Albibacillus kandeliae TaxID=2174228 RepID=UPI000D68559D|nr:histidine kinase N-terminal 7TM domain-containing protein [Albibacillus kandeliae]
MLATLTLVATVSYLVRRFPNTLGHGWFMLAMAAMAWWLLSVLLEFSSHTFDCKVLAARVAWPGIVLTPTAWAFFLYEYALARRVPGWARWVGLLIAPALITAAALAVPYYDGFYGTGTRLVDNGVRLSVIYDHGPVFFASVAYLYVVVLSSVAITFRALTLASLGVRSFLKKLLVVTMLPITADLAYTFGGVTIFGMDPTPLVFSVSLSFVFWMSTDHRWVDMTAIGRDLIFYNTRDPIVLADMQGRLIDANPEAKSVLALKGVAEQSSLLAHPDIGDMIGHLRTGDAEGAVRIIRRDGRSFAARVYPLSFLHAGHQLGWLISLVDVSAQEEAAEKAQAADLAKTRFLSTVSHELRTPLTVIKGATELLARANVAAEPEKVEKLIRLARDNAETLARLVDDLLDVQRLEKAEFSISMERLDLNQLAETALTRIESYQANKPMTFEFRPAPVAVPVDGDRQRLMQVLANILSNAIKFSKDPGVVRLSVSVVGSQAEVRISDNGIGIPEDARAKVFGRFTQVDSSDTRNRGGSGLGMHITQQILEQHGGSIDYESVIGEGTTFIALVPLAVAAPVADKGADPVVAKPAPVQVAS